jgi:pyruvate formate lyase activating enzyme
LDTDVPIVLLEVCVSAKQELTGRIFNIQKYSIYDGDGIRTLVFSKAAISLPVVR